MSILDKVTVIKNLISTFDKVIHVVIKCIDYVLEVADNGK